MRYVQENCASPPPDAWPGIETDDADEVVKMIVTPKGLCAEAQGERDRAVVGWRARIVAPA
jgi:hypothetical protein